MPAPKTTPQERAAAAVEVIKRKIERAQRRRVAAEQQVREAAQDQRKLQQELEYALSHPALVSAEAEREVAGGYSDLSG